MRRRTLLQRSQKRHIVEPDAPCHKPVLIAHGFNQSLLTSVQNFEWQCLEIAEHPHQIKSLKNGRFQIPRPERGQYSQHPSEEFFNPHTRDQAPGISPQNLMYSKIPRIIAPELEHGKRFS